MTVVWIDFIPRLVLELFALYAYSSLAPYVASHLKWAIYKLRRLGWTVLFAWYALYRATSLSRLRKLIYPTASMGNTDSFSCTSGEKSSKAQRKEEMYTKTKPEENGTKTNGNVDGEVVASSEVKEVEVKETEVKDCESAPKADKTAADETPAENKEDSDNEGS